jgi:hypothetical protein
VLDTGWGGHRAGRANADHRQTAYSVTFAAFLLFWGRVSDLYSAKPVFLYGFAGLGV